ncbi:M phase phosphoprotein 10 [Cucumis melo]|uniref:U3 small nucleolar ribonucleoprotein protein MPP10 n=1 Tax=Cucumis melo TaxID=3656 RepID=A0A1S3CLH1_CUCME|nr:M phase phosphoprotein 10 [Cucumis melo]XP_008464446.1 M phase phosphoprotein 10 [Cucumis melo]XP_008464447.1 M phase phosphoprotein 10 [Cucumis melo]XP_050937116.1 M phase phosphoprotein 10 [Cucumis melo]
MEAEKVVLPNTEAGLKPLHSLKSTDPPLWLAPSPSLSQVARLASQSLFSMLKPFNPKSPFDHLLVDGFDAEQIWQQIDLQSQPLLASVRRDLKRFEKNPEAISNLKVSLEDKKKVIQEMAIESGEESDDFEEDMKELDEEEDDEEEEEEEEDCDDKEDGDTEEGEKEKSDDEVEGEEGNGGIEDGFLKLKELEEFMEEDEVREYGLQNKKDGKKEKKQRKTEEESEDDEDDELGEFDLHGEEDEDSSKLDKARYEDFFGAKKKNHLRRKSKLTNGSESELSDSGDEEEENETRTEPKSENLSTHQKRLKKLQSEIEMMEKANLEPKTWTMQGEVTAMKRPKNSALEVDLDFEHNVRPPPVITEEVTATLEEMIQKRILEGRFDEVQKAPKRPTKAPREIKELDENKSKKGLGELYEEEYVEKTNLATAPSSFTDEAKTEASILFKKLCSKLDALSHYHYAPKPVIEDMSISTNVPALAMEEVAPVAVSDAAMLAPEEVFAGKGEIKEAAELTQSDRKRRRASKKRKYKAMVAKRDAKKSGNTTVPNANEGQ